MQDVTSPHMTSIRQIKGEKIKIKSEEVQGIKAFQSIFSMSALSRHFFIKKKKWNNLI